MSTAHGNAGLQLFPSMQHLDRLKTLYHPKNITTVSKTWKKQLVLLSHIECFSKWDSFEWDFGCLPIWGYNIFNYISHFKINHGKAPELYFSLSCFVFFNNEHEMGDRLYSQKHRYIHSNARPLILGLISYNLGKRHFRDKPLITMGVEKYREWLITEENKNFDNDCVSEDKKKNLCTPMTINGSSGYRGCSHAALATLKICSQIPRQMFMYNIFFCNCW